jgi:hypothetical protein
VGRGDDEQGVPWRAFLGEAERRLADAGLPSPEVDARRIVERVTGASGAELILALDDLATERGVAYLDAMLARREAGEPLQYVLGAWGFRHLDLFVDRRVLIPRPETEEVEVDIDQNDLQIDVYRSSGPGGQSVNTTDSAVRITHKPTGLVVAMQDEKSQIQNRAKALQVLRSRLLKLEQDRQAAELSGQRRDQVGGGGRSEKIRTYNFKENRLTDHRINLTIYKLDKVLAGELDEVVDALVLDERTRRLGDDG